MARTRSENYDDIQQGILTAACALFARQGYMRASIAELADACRISRGALYHYFDSKEAILFAIVDAHIRRMIADVDAAMARQATTPERFRAAIHAIVALNAQSSNEQRVILNDVSFLNETEEKSVKALQRRLVDTISDLLVQLDAEGKIVKRAKKVYTMMLFGMLNFSHTWYDPKGDIKPHEFADMVVDLFLHGFVASPVIKLTNLRQRQPRAG